MYIRVRRGMDRGIVCKKRRTGKKEQRGVSETGNGMGKKMQQQPFDRFKCFFNRKVIVLFCINTVQVMRRAFHRV